MTDQMIARYLLHLWDLIYQRWVKSNISAACQAAVDARLAALKTAVADGNVPDLSEMLGKYFKLADGLVMQQAPGLAQAWTAEEWAAAQAEKQRVIELMQAELVRDQELAAMVEMHQACIAKLQAELAEMQVV